jgi:uncharacterized repeat protein (TIGR01451 family)
MKKVFTLFTLMLFFALQSLQAQNIYVNQTYQYSSCYTQGEVFTITLGGVPPYISSFGDTVFYQGYGFHTTVIPGLPYYYSITDSIGEVFNDSILVPITPSFIVDSITVIQPSVGNPLATVTVHANPIFNDSIIYNIQYFTAPNYVPSGIKMNTPFSVSTTSTTVYTVSPQSNACPPYTFTVNGIPQPLSIDSIDIINQCGSSQIQIHPSFGTPPYSYTVIPGGINSTSGIINSLANGTYTITAQDALGNTAASVISLLSTLPQIDSLVSFSNCVGNGFTLYSNDSLSFTYSPGGSSSYFVSAGNPQTINLNPQFATSYTITATNSQGCTQTTITTLFPLQALIAVANVQTQACVGSPGTASILASGGTPPYSYSWNTTPIQTTALATNLLPGYYTSTVTDANGCTASSSLQLTQNSLVSSAITDTICAGDTTSLIATANGSLIVGPSTLPVGYCSQSAGTAADEDIWNFSINGFSNTSSCSSIGSGSTLSINGLPASILSKYGNYTNLQMPPFSSGSTISFSVTLGQCGTFGYNASYAIFIDYNRNGVFDLPTERVYGLPTVTTIAPTGSIFTGSFTIPVNTIPGTTLMRVVCIESQAGTAITPCGTYNYGETEDYKISIGTPLSAPFIWSASSSLNSLTGSNVIASPTSTTTYTVSNSDPLLCNSTSTVTVVVKSGLTNASATSVHTNVDCPLSQDGIISIAATPSTANLQYSWSNNASTAASQSNLGVGAYYITVTDTLGGCITLQDSIISLGVNCGDVIGKVIEDSNKNCIINIGEQGIPNTMITLNPGNHITYTDAMGNYVFNGLPYNTYTVNHTPAAGFGANCTSAFTNTISSSNLIISATFLDSSSLYYDYHVGSSGWCLAPALGNNYRNIYYGHNQVSHTSSGVIYAVFDSIQHYASSVPSHTSIIGDTVFWNLNNITYSWNQNIHVNFYLDSTLPLGITIPWKIGYASTQYNDTNQFNNKQNLSFITCTSFDPNDKFVTPRGKTSLGYITKQDKLLTYTVHFQNTGNATAANVVVMDTLSPNVDITTFKVLQASHNYGIEIINNHIVKFKFLGIMLPDSGANQDGSNGDITYSIQQLPNLLAGSEIKNTAHIYFDYNAAIVTGTTLNTIYDKLQSPTVSSTTKNTVCNPALCGNGSATVGNVGGINPITYSVSPMCSTITVNGNTISNLKTTNYIVTSTDAIGNTASSLLSISQAPSNLAIGNAVMTQPAAGLYGSISIVGANGVAPYSYSWNPGNFTTSNISNLHAGTYVCTITDAAGCSIQSQYIINEALGINDLAKNNSIQVYPNPVSDLLHIESIEALQQIRVINMLGTTVLLVQTNGARSTDISTSSLANGMYQLQTNTGASKRFEVKK